MADCPMCGSRLDIIKWRWITNVLGLTKPYFKCPACSWKMTVKEVHTRGGIHGIKRGLSSGGGRRNLLSSSRPTRKRNPSQKTHRKRNYSKRNTSHRRSGSKKRKR